MLSRRWRGFLPVMPSAEKVNCPSQQTDRENRDPSRVVDTAGREKSFNESGKHEHHHAADFDTQGIAADAFQSRAATDFTGHNDGRSQEIACRPGQADGEQFRSPMRHDPAP